MATFFASSLPFFSWRPFYNFRSPKGDFAKSWALSTRVAEAFKINIRTKLEEKALCTVIDFPLTERWVVSVAILICCSSVPSRVLSLWRSWKLWTKGTLPWCAPPKWQPWRSTESRYILTDGMTSMMTGLMQTLLTCIRWAGVRKQDMHWNPLSVSMSNVARSIASRLF